MKYINYEILLNKNPYLFHKIMHDIEDNFVCPECGELNIIDFALGALICATCGSQLNISLDEYVKKTPTTELAQQLIAFDTKLTKENL